MNPDRLAKIVAQSIALHQSRGLVDDAAGLNDVVIHGRVDLTSVASDLIAAALADTRSARKSWSAWFAFGVEQRQQDRRRQRKRERLAQRLENASTPADTAIARLRMRELD